MADEHGLDRDRLVWMFTQMLRIREFEERVKRSFTELPGLLRGHTHLADGAEASIVRRPGSDVTIVATGWMVARALAAAERLAGEGVSAEVIDPRTLAPLDTATVIESVSRTGHLVLVDQATRHASASAVIAAGVADAGFGYLKAPIKQVTGLDTPIPYSKPMEEHVLPDEDKIVEAVRQALSTTLVT
ncbi:MAG TPA: transketolase C-terminal domain-containing protein [Streptosporangiaceae bacterium]|nr:transketolase C-terminal domain-containing protein [Streptosporangiaceae bacterium]